MRAFACCAAAAATAGALVPTPVGPAPRYRPAAAVHGPCRAAPLRTGGRVHLELFANRRVAIVPAALGLGGPRSRQGRVVAARCRGAAWTLDPSGVVRFEPGATLGRLFSVWGRRLAPGRLLTFSGRVRLYVNGARRPGDPRRLRLRDGDELVLEVGGYVPPHETFRFPPGP